MSYFKDFFIFEFFKKETSKNKENFCYFCLSIVTCILTKTCFSKFVPSRVRMGSSGSYLKSSDPLAIKVLCFGKPWWGAV